MRASITPPTPKVLDILPMRTVRARKSRCQYRPKNPSGSQDPRRFDSGVRHNLSMSVAVLDHQVPTDSREPVDGLSSRRSDGLLERVEPVRSLTMGPPLCSQNAHSWTDKNTDTPRK